MSGAAKAAASAWELPRELSAGGERRRIRSDFRAALDVFAALADPELDGQARAAVILKIMYVSPEAIPSRAYDEAVRAACAFLSGPRGYAQAAEGRGDAGTRPPKKLFDWVTDADIIAAAVNGAAGRDVRAEPYLHWWTFLSFFNEIGDCLFSTVVAIRKKKSEKKKLTAAEEEFARENPQYFAPVRTSPAEEMALLDWLTKTEADANPHSST